MFSLTVAMLFSVLLVSPQDTAAGPPPIAAMEFGSAHVGPPIDKGRGHPSAHAADSLRPRTVVISAGGTVMFKLMGSQVHQVAIYGPGTKPEDINVDDKGAFGVLCAGNGKRFIKDPNNLIEIVDNPPCASGSNMISTSPETFMKPGRYLVICTFDSHFNNFNMYGWVIVK
jgi:plastocyanin